MSERAITAAITETGAVAQSSEAEVDACLRVLALNGGGVKRTIDQLRAAEISTVSVAQLTRWRDSLFRSRYYEIRRQLAGEVSEDLAGRSLERAMQADDVQAEALERLAENVSELRPSDLAPAVRALAQAKDSDVKVAQLLRDRPTEIKETRSVSELMQVLNSVPGLIEGNVMDAEVVEDE